MALLTQQESDFPNFWTTIDYNPQDTPVRFVGCRIENNTTFRCRVDLRWDDTPRGGTPVFVEPGESWEVTGLNLPMKNSDKFGVSYGRA